MMKNNSKRGFFKAVSAILAVTGFILFALAPVAEARRSGRNPVQPGKNNCRLAKGSVKMPGYPVYNSFGVQVATKRLTVLWRYVDANCDGIMTWGVPVPPATTEGRDYLRLVPRTEYTFTAPLATVPSLNPLNGLYEIQTSTHHFGPLDPATGFIKSSSFRLVKHDDLIPGLPVPGDLLITNGTDGLPIPGLSFRISMFTDSGDAFVIPHAMETWGARFILQFTSAAFAAGAKIPAGAYTFLDSQLNAYDIVPSANGSCEFGFFEEDFVSGSSQLGPNTANTTDLNVVPVPIHFALQCSNNTTP